MTHTLMTLNYENSHHYVNNHKDTHHNNTQHDQGSALGIRTFKHDNNNKIRIKTLSIISSRIMAQHHYSKRKELGATMIRIKTLCVMMLHLMTLNITIMFCLLSLYLNLCLNICPTEIEGEVAGSISHNNDTQHDHGSALGIRILNKTTLSSITVRMKTISITPSRIMAQHHYSKRKELGATMIRIKTLCIMMLCLITLNITIMDSLLSLYLVLLCLNICPTEIEA